MNPAIQDLMDDHQVILRMLSVLNGICLRLREGQAVAVADLDAAVDFIKTFADFCHHGKEEDILFPAMVEMGLPRESGPIAVMLMEHEQGRAYVRSLGAALERVRSGEPEALKDVSCSAMGYVSLLTDHIGKEDGILYPMAIDAIPPERWTVLKNEFDRVERERMGPQRRAGYIELVDRLLIAYPAPQTARPPGRV
ncbi:MAG: hypothetical protein A3J70_04860 [Elusimicrobia bacterium RIFCSPHIGHO2_02_FULL_61_10]|nr:MAG: hypothetical protein A3J70_04860 [Elusimicrobia bacterium RIFCSPHIGHO2_02_FULL_61_10]